MGFEKWGITGWIAAAVTLGSGVFLGARGTGVEGVRAWVHVTAWTSCALFLVAFSARPLHQVLKARGTAALLASRRYVGVGAAYAHGVHGVAILWFLSAFESDYELRALTLGFGGLGYAFYAAMAATSSDAAVARLGRMRWKQLHTAGGYYLWFIYAYTLLGSVASQGGLVRGLLLAGCLGCVALRAAVRVRGRRRGLQPA